MIDERELTENGRKTRRQIYEAAVQLLLRDGYDKLTIKKICQASGTSNGSFYHFFRNKDELLAYYYNVTAEKFLEEQSEDFADESLYDQMMICYQWYTKHSASHGVDFCRNFFIPSNRSIDPGHMHNAFYEISVDCLHAHKDELAEGRDPDLVAHDLCVLAKGIIADWSNTGGAYDITEATERMFSAYLKGVLK